MISKYTWDCPRCPAEKGTNKNKVLEFYGMWDPTEFNVEHLTYFCRKCGYVVKKIVNHETKETTYRIIEPPIE